jgi:putative DNA primase/helicase
MARIEAGDVGDPVVKKLDANRVRHHLSRAATWKRWTNQGLVTIEPPMPIVNDVIASPNQPLPILTRIVEAPVFAPDGSLQTAPGYHPASQTFYVPAPGFFVPDVPEFPTPEDVQAARELIATELLGDFPFLNDAERSHAIALLLLPFARDLFIGPTPLHLFEKPSPGTGATLLVDILSYPALGRPIPAMTEGSDEDEWRKRITAKLMAGSPFLLIDNLRKRLDSAAVAGAITAMTWEDRILGVSEMAHLPVRCGWIATGNNPTVSTEIARRTVRVRLDAKMDQPWLRKEFRHPNLRQWAAQNRGRLVWAALTLIRAWVAAGRPSGQRSLGMFENWAATIGGVLDVAGTRGFLTNLSEMYAEADAEGADWRSFIGAWWHRHQGSETAVRDLWNLVQAEGFLALGDGSEQSQKVTLAKMLNERRDRVFDLDGNPGRMVLRRGEKYQGAYQWQLAVAT